MTINASPHFDLQTRREDRALWALLAAWVVLNTVIAGWVVSYAATADRDYAAPASIWRSQQ